MDYENNSSKKYDECVICLEDMKTNAGIKNFFEKAKRFWKN